MIMKRQMLILMCAFILGAPALAMSGHRTTASATLSDVNGKMVGTAKAIRRGAGIAITVKVNGLPAGERGIHIHTTGKCEAPGFQSAGGHWNPQSRQHGRDNPMGAHHGDLPNISVNSAGRGSLTFIVPNATIEGEGGLLDADGAAIVIHEKADDYRTDPTGNSGGRLICGVFAKR
jgi:superoxide dismutase, Cu-Zn family